MNILEFAINMELEGEKFYDEQAEQNKDNSLNVVFQMLAKDEKMHAKVLENKFKNTSAELEPNETLSQANSLFNEFVPLNDVYHYSNQVNAYRLALEKEKESIDFYKKCLAEEKDEDSKRLFENLIKQEEEHYEIIDQLISLIRNSEEWVESAEFGLRGEY